MLDLQAEDDVVIDGAPFKEFVVLEHVAYVRSAFFEVLSVDLDQALLWFKQTCDQ